MRNKKENSSLKLTDEQILMLQLSAQDISKGKFISQEQLDKNDFEWLEKSQLTGEQRAELDKRMERYQNGIGKTYTWEETVAHINEQLSK